jgi:hypothetical protein
MIHLMQKQIRIVLVLVSLSSLAGAASAGEKTAEQWLQQFEKKIQDAPAATIIYSGVKITRRKEVEIARERYGGCWQVQPGAKKASVRYDGAEMQHHRVEGLEVQTDSEFYLQAPRFFYFGPISRNGFAVGGKMEEWAVLPKVMSDFRLVERKEADPPGARGIAYKYALDNVAKDGPRQVTLWIDEKTLAPLRRTIRWRDGDQDIEATEEYRGFSLADIPAPFGKNVLSTEFAKVAFESGRVTALQGRVDWPTVGSKYRAETQTALRFNNARATLAPDSEFTLSASGLSLTRGRITMEFLRPDLISLALGSVSIRSQTRCVLVATPDRVISEEGNFQYSPNNKAYQVLPEGVEHRLLEGELKAEKERTLPPAAATSKVRVLWQLDWKDPKQIEGKLRQGKVTQHDGRPVLASVKQVLTFDPGADDLLTFKPTTAIRFRYFVLGTTRPDFIVTLENRTQKSTEKIHAMRTSEKHWTTLTVPLTKMRQVSAGKATALGDRFGALTWDWADILIDRLEVVELEP